MKITETDINHNAVRMISDIIGTPFEYVGHDEDSANQMIATIGGVYGVILMAQAMKEVLDA